MTVLVPNADEAERQELPGGGANVQPRLDPRAHPPGPRVGLPSEPLPTRAADAATREEAASTRDRRRPSPSTALLALLAALLLAACGGDLGGGGDGEVTVAEAEGEPSGELTISNWPVYIDRKTRPRVRERRPASTVNYIEDVNDNNEIFAQAPADARSRATRRAAASSSSPTGWRRRCTTSATCRTSTRTAIPTGRREPARVLAKPELRPRAQLLAALAERA